MCYRPASGEVELRLDGEATVTWGTLPAKAGRGLEVFDERGTETRQSGQEDGK